jgi:D-alanyl-D-alanine dipeptidase
MYKVISVLFFLSVLASAREASDKLTSAPQLVSLETRDPTIIHEIRYAAEHNFLGRPVKGYNAPKCLLTPQAAEALVAVQAELRAQSLSLKVYDCYRPQRAVNDFVRWAKDLSDIKMKNEFYPKVEKTSLFRAGYLAEKSGHSRASTVDLTIVALPVSPQSEFSWAEPLKACYLAREKRFADNSLDMGTGYDCFDPRANTANPSISKLQKKNRLLLKTMMEAHGFENAPIEWWHYTLKDEPYPNKYFDLPIEK